MLPFKSRNTYKNPTFFSGKRNIIPLGTGSCFAFRSSRKGIVRRLSKNVVLGIYKCQKLVKCQNRNLKKRSWKVTPIEQWKGINTSLSCRMIRSHLHLPILASWGEHTWYLRTMVAVSADRRKKYGEGHKEDDSKNLWASSHSFPLRPSPPTPQFRLWSKISRDLIHFPSPLSPCGLW